MERKITWLIMICLMVSILVLASCTASGTANVTSNTPSATATSAATTTQTTPSKTSTTTTTNPTASDDNLANILGLAQKIPAMKYDMVMTTPGVSPITTTTWVKNTKMKMETTAQGLSSIVFIDQVAKTAVTYMPTENIAMKMNFDQAQKSVAQGTNTIEQNNPKNLGTETIDGKTCVVLEYTVSSATTKMWIWKDRGLPVKVETTSATGTTLIEYKNYDFSDIPDSMFTLPEGVQVILTP